MAGSTNKISAVPSELPAKVVQDGVILSIRITPKGGANRIEGTGIRGESTYLKVRVSAPPEDGKANAALIEALAAWLNMPKSSFSVIGGHKSRQKSILVSGKAEELLPKILSLLQG